MARFIDLGDNDDEQELTDTLAQRLLQLQPHPYSHHIQVPLDAGHQTNNPVVLGTDSSMDIVRTQNVVTRAFYCYPLVSAIVSNLDLTSLDSLSRACYYIHESLLQNRQVLIQSTIHCSNEAQPMDPNQVLRYRARAGNWFYMEDGRNWSGKSGDCARDLVGPCRRCSVVVCRNCAIKPPAPVTLRERHRRLCNPCRHLPIGLISRPHFDPVLPLTSDLARRAVCHCETEGVWLCQPCGKSIRGADHEYNRIWRWRSHYGEVLGGLGTGVGAGDRGVICGRDEDCCAAKECEQEVDCDAEYGRDNPLSSWDDLLSPSPSTSQPPTPATHHNNPLEQIIEDYRHDRTPSPQLRTGYERHEIEGIGGVVKRKLTRMVRVGACVPEWEDEHGPGRKPLQREARGELRSWCGWCWRVIPGQMDKPGVETVVCMR